MHASSFGHTGLSDPALRAGHLRPEPGPAPPVGTSLAPARRSLLTIGVRIGAGFAVALLLLALLSTTLNARLQAGEEERQWVQHSLEVLSKNERALRMIKEAETAA